MSGSPDRVIAQYRLIERIGQGGMGVVWRARDSRLDRDVAIKTLPPDLVGDESRRHRFIREAKAAAAVSHPNIAAIHDVGEADGVVYLAMELVEGRTLRECAAGGPIPMERALGFGAQIAEGLGRAHREGIVHRDIKPENIMVDESDHVKILDFGLARFRGAQEEEGPTEVGERETLSALTQEGQTLGTIPYMSPEQARGAATDGRSDIFSLGIVLYEMLTGHHPFRQDTPIDTMAAILNKPPADPTSLNPRLGSRLSELLDKCLQKDPARRYQTSGDLALDLRRLAAVSTASSFVPAAAPAPRRTALIPALAIAAILVVVALALWAARAGKGASTGPVASAASITSLAVIPLDDYSPGESEQYFADGMTEALITEIAQLADLRVISRTSVMKYRGEDRPSIPDIARDLNVDAIVEGSVMRDGGRIRITAQLIRASDDRHIWAGSYERDHKDVLALQREVATAVAGEIQGALRPRAARSTAPTRLVDPEAHDLYLRAEQDLDIGTEEALRRSLATFESALKIDPEYAQAWVGISRAYQGLANVYVAPRKAMPKAKRAVLHAIAIDPDLAEAYTNLSSIQWAFDWNLAAAERSMRRAQELNPNLPEAVLEEAWVEMTRGNLARTNELVQKARSLDPYSPGVASIATWILVCAREYDRAMEINDELLKRYPANAGFIATRATLLEFLDPEKGVEAAERAVELDEAIWSLAQLARSQAIAGREAEARETLARMESAPGDLYQCPYETALSWSALGEYDRARALFEQGIEERAVCWAQGDQDPRVDPLKEFPWFQELLARRTPMGPDDPDFVE